MTTSGPLVHLVGKGWQLENGRAVGQLCAKNYVDTFTRNDRVTYNRKIVHFLSALFLTEVHTPDELYSKAHIEQFDVYFNPDLAC